MAASTDGESLPSLLDLITKVDNLPLNFATNHAPYYKFLLPPDPRPHGFIHPSTVSRLPWPPGLFAVDHAAARVSLVPGGDPNSALQAAVDAALALATTDPTVFPTLSGGMHSEHFRIPGIQSTPPLRVERFAASLFGINTRGAHLTAYVRDPTTAAITHLWVARRAAALRTFPGMLDSTVAGGVKADDAPLDCVLAEAEEEARLPPEVVKPRLRAAGVVTLANRNPRTELVHGEILYVYDLDLSPPPGGAASELGLVPQPGDDDEVDEFVLMDWQGVLRRMRAGEFKPNVCPVMIDFFIRHGLITPETEERYVEICNRLRRRLPMPTNAHET
ncbi:thiamin pyrophosphokinase-related protein [Cordyceps fumosorosea ARSEF 2679]|uniref:Thiamin pyrophosphokinase-related protein n=1 Tax=Cordyceps fumosorosea (strain ARSEF 2679) TaxID=1081104 RepID=A0A167ZGH7_CORFA|nr:thiamin pyrophosphokinase-related protein [Cordyceps fumosorosea ARSEF 2679]OAA67488.1 thiamin pyrophosphokinase-related protein [Cordyceps fumosorosea ARSEF 2679]